MSNTTPTSPKPSTASTQNSPSGWTTAQPATKRERPNYASPTASSAATTTTGRAKSRTLDATTKASISSTTSPGTASATKEKKVSLRRNTEKSLSPTPATSQAWVSAKKGAKSTTPPPATTTTAIRRGRGSASQDETSLSARIEASSTMNELKKTGTTTEALDLLDPNMTRARSSSRMKRSVSDADLAFEAALEIQNQIKSGTPPPQIEEEELSGEEEHQEEEIEEESQESQSPPQEQVEPTHTETQNEIQPSKSDELSTPARAVPQILVSQAKEPEEEHPEEIKPEEPVQQIQEPTPQIQDAVPQVQEHAPETQEAKPAEPVHQIQEPTPQIQEPVPQIQEVVPQTQEPTVQIQPHEEEKPSSPQIEPQQPVEHHEPSKQDPPEQPKEPQSEPVVHVEAKEAEQPTPVETPAHESKEHVVEHPARLSLQQQPEATKPPQESQTSQEPASSQVVEAPAPVQEEVKEVKEPEVASQNATLVVVPAEPAKHEVLKNSTDSQESDALQFSMEPQKEVEPSKEQRPSSPAPTEASTSTPTTTPTRQEEPKSIIDIIEQQELKRRQDEENRRKALLEQEDKIKRSVQDKIQKALEERRKQVLSPNSEDGRRKSFDTTDLATSVPMSPAPLVKPPSDGNLPIYISPTRQQNNPISILSASAPGPPSILSSSPRGSGSVRDFKRVSFNFEDGRILYPGTDGHLDLVTHAPKRKDEEKENEKEKEKEKEKSGSPEKSAPTVSVTAPVEKTEKPASPIITSTGFVPATTSPQSKEEAKQAALAEKRKSINDRIQMMLNVDSGQQRRRSFDERDAEELKTIRNQQDQRAKQEEEQQKQFNQSRAKEFEEKKKKQIEEFKKQRDNIGTSNLYEKEAMEEQQRLDRLKENRPVNESDDPNLKGFDAELAKKMADNIDPSWEFNACKWVEQLSGETVYDAGECLYTGIVLCKLINAIKPNMIAKFYSKPIALMQTENIKLYLIACQQLGVAKDDLFSVSDLHNRKNMKAVISNIYALARNVQTQPEWKGPTLLNVGAPPKNPSPRPSTKSVAIPTTQGRDRSKTEDLTPGFQSSAPEFRERSKTAGAKLSSNVPDLQHEVVTLRDELETLRRMLAEKDKVIKVLKPPKWRPDEDVERCTLCAMEFTFWNRRHHCRQCGEIFCGECCSKSIEITQLNKQMEKVCNRCHVDLQQFQRNMGPTLDSWNVY